MKIGDKIRIVKLPDGLIDERELQTRSLFAFCLGASFSNRGDRPSG